jgi:uncharacterized protein YndB with AHSA1/START domain
MMIDTNRDAATPGRPARHRLSRRVRVVLLFGVAMLVSDTLFASGTLVPEPGSDSYRFVSHYRITIDVPVSTVWKHLVDVGAWMYEFDMTLESGVPGEVGEIRRLYSGQEFLVQITKVVPNEMLAISNLPSTFNGEYSTGVSVITLNESNGGTVVDLTMSRRYEWRGEGENPMQARRASAEFNASTDATWGRFLERLRSLCEGT